MPRRMSPGELDDAARLYASGQSFQQVATRLGHNADAIGRALRRRGVEARPRGGRPAYNRLPAPSDLHQRFADVGTVLALSRHYEVDRGAVSRWLTEAGLEVPSASQAATTQRARLTPEERSARAAAAHATVRGSTKSAEVKARVALGRERVQYGGRTSPGCDYLSTGLGRRGVPHVREKAVGPYNVDIALPDARIAVEVLGGNWHGSKPIHAQRTPYILNQGWSLLFVWNTKRCQVGPGALDYLIAYGEAARLDPPSRSEYRVIGGNGQLVAAGGPDDEDFPLVPPSISDLWPRAIH